MKEQSTEVMIVGAGPTGLFLANDLQRRGVSFLLVDRLESPPQGSRALYLQARSLEALAELGLLPSLAKKGLLVERIRLYRDGKLEDILELETASRRDAPYPYLLVVEQHVTESLLAARLRESGSPVKRGWELNKVCHESDQVRSFLETANGVQVIRSDYLVGCDGPSSRVRQALDTDFSRTVSDQVYQTADLELEWELPANEVVRLVNARQEVIATPLPGKNRYRLSLWSSKLSPTPLTLPEWEQAVQAVAPGDFALANPRSLKCYRASQGMASTFSRGRLFLAGDAAHVVPHSLAQGLNLGLQDAHNLGWRLALVLQGESPPEHLANYQKERMPIARQALEPASTLDSTHWTSFLQSRDELERWSQLELDEEGPQRGDRVPDGELRNGTRTKYLYDLLDGLRFHLLVFSNRKDPQLESFVERLTSPERSSLAVHRIGIGPGATVDVEACLHRSFSAKHGDLVLIRPDRVLALRVDLSEKARLIDFLSEHLVDSF